MKVKRKYAHIRLVAALVIVAVLFSFTACGAKEDPKMNSFIPETEPAEPRETETVPERTKPAWYDEVMGEEDDEDEEGEEAYGSFFGKRMKKSLVRVNEKNLKEPDCMMADILAEPAFTVTEVLTMMDSYSFPDRQHYGERTDIDAVRAEIRAYMNTDVLREKVTQQADEPCEVRYGILVNNSSVRSFPTELRAYNDNESQAWDMFQESMLLYGDGVLVLHETADGYWSFVQGINYYGWIKTQDIGFCSRNTYLEYLTQDKFLVRTAVIPNDIAPLNRLGVIIPYTKKDENGTSYSVLLPARTEDGSLVIEERIVSGEDLSDRYHDGFMDYSEENVVSLARSLIDVPYGYGDLHSNYDCSSFVSLTYRVFGIFMPRNCSGICRAKGLHIENVTNMSDTDKEALIMEHPGAIVYFPGHVMISTGKTNSTSGTRAGIVHCNTSYYSEGDGDPSHLVTTEKVTENMIALIHSGSGRTFLTKAEAVIWYDR
ncbi:MAG: SH3 domain-containing protein [Lachnospiraceae bacterium]|nr:SH3 domain-containing protein [Lachnospiraceae bacterium]